MQPALVIRSFIASPTDVQPERDVAVQVVTNWNAAHSLDRDAIVEAIRVETHAQAALGDHPQEIVNRQLLDRCDFLVAIFWSKLGMATNKERSGTVHEIREFIKRKGAENVLLFFSKDNLPHDIDSTQLESLRKFRKEMQKEGLYIGYVDLQDFHKQFSHQLAMRMNELLKTEEAQKAWSQKALMDEEDKIAIESKRKTMEYLAEAGRIQNESHRAEMSKLAGREISAPISDSDEEAFHEPRLKLELQEIASFFTRRLDENAREGNNERAKRLARQVKTKLNDVLIQCSTEASEGIRKELFGFLGKLSQFAESGIGIGCTFGSMSAFWAAADDLTSELHDLIAMI